MRIFFLAILFFSGFISVACAQANISYPQWQHPVLQQARAGVKNFTSFYNKDTTSFITVSITDNQQKIIYWFDCYGYYFDAVAIGDDNLQVVLKKNITAFKYYDLITASYLKIIIKARSNLQTNGNTAKFTAHKKQLLQIDDSLTFPSTLKKLIELDKQKLSVERQIREFHSVNPHKIKPDTAFANTIPLPYGSMQTTWEQQDTITTYYNRIPITPVYKAVFNHSAATIAYFNRGNQLIDDLPINKESVSLLFAEKTDVFLLYRGWLEMQRFNIVKSIANIKASEKQFIKSQKNPGVAKGVSTKNSYQPLLAYAKKLLQVADYKINYFTTIDRGFVSQCLRNQYLQTSNSISGDEARLSTFTRGNKNYELTDARGNVMAVVTDKKIQYTLNGTTVEYYEPDIAAATDYAPFGSALPGRNHQSDKYRYGFNGKENDNEIKGEGNQQDYGMRIYDPRLGRFLSVDPITKEYPWYTPYQFAGNKPIWATDLDGLEENTTSSYVYHPPVLAIKPSFQGIISITDATAQKAHQVFKGNFANLAKAFPSAKGIVNSLTASNVGNAGSRLDIAMTSSSSRLVKTWKGTDIKYFTQYSYSFSSNNVSEIGTFELNSASIHASARAWDPLAFLLMNKVVSSIVVAGIARTGKSVATEEMITLFRSISKAEAESIQSTKQLSLGQGGMEVKQFWQTKEGLDKFNNSPGFEGAYNLEMTVPKSLLGRGKALNTATQVDDFYGPTVTIDAAEFNTVNQSVQSFKITPIK